MLPNNMAVAGIVMLALSIGAFGQSPNRSVCPQPGSTDPLKGMKISLVSEMGTALDGYEILSVQSAPEFLGEGGLTITGMCVKGLKSFGEYRFQAAAQRRGSPSKLRPYSHMFSLDVVDGSTEYIAVIRTVDEVTPDFMFGHLHRFCGSIAEGIWNKSHPAWVEIYSTGGVGVFHIAQMDSKGGFCFRSVFENGRYTAVAYAQGAVIATEVFDLSWQTRENAKPRTITFRLLMRRFSNPMNGGRASPFTWDYKGFEMKVVDAQPVSSTKTAGK